MKRTVGLVPSILMIAAMLLTAACTAAPAASVAPAAPAAEPAAPAEKPAEASAEAIAITVAGVSTNPDSAQSKGLVRFQELVAEKTAGKYKVDIYSGTLGNERDMIEALQLGTLNIAQTASAPYLNFSTAFTVVDLPYIFASREEAYGVLDSEIGQEMFDKLYADAGIVGLAYWCNGFRHISNSIKPLKTLADLKGMKLRTMESSLCIDTFSALGANVAPIAWGEVYTALQQGTVDAQEGSVQNTYLGKFHEVTQYYTYTYHFYSPTIMACDGAWFNALPTEDQALIKEACVEAGKYEREVAVENEDAYRKKMEEEGVVFNDVDNIDEWRAAVTGVYDSYMADIGEEFFTKVQAEAKKYAQ